MAGRVRVEIDGLKPLVFSVTVEFEEGVEITMALRYEKLFGFCRECFHLTHDQSRCPALIKEDNTSLTLGGYEDDGAGPQVLKLSLQMILSSMENGERASITGLKWREAEIRVRELPERSKGLTNRRTLIIHTKKISQEVMVKAPLSVEGVRAMVIEGWVCIPRAFNIREMVKENNVH